MAHELVMYHYTHLKKWEVISEGSIYPLPDPITKKLSLQTNFKGLWPFREVVPSFYFPEGSEANISAVFGFPELMPKSWIDYQRKDYRPLKHLMDLIKDEDNKVLLLEVNLKPEDKPLVIDYHYWLRGNPDLFDESERRTRKQAVKDYWNSRIQLTDYDGRHVLPEVIVQRPIPLERIQILGEIDARTYLS